MPKKEKTNDIGDEEKEGNEKNTTVANQGGRIVLAGFCGLHVSVDERSIDFSVNGHSALFIFDANLAPKIP